MDPMLAEAPPEAPLRGDAETRTMREDDLLAFEWAADPQISPDGTRIAFTRVRVDTEADEYRTSLWLIAAAGGAPRRLTAGELDSQPRWSPDGRSLAFVRATEAGKPGQLCVLPMSGGEATVLTKLAKGASEPAWSPDGRRLAFLSTTNPALDEPEPEKPKKEPGRVVTRPSFRENGEGFIDVERRPHVWVVEAGGGAPRQLTCGRYGEAMPRWSRDGARVLFVSDRRQQPWFGDEESKLYAVSAERSAPTDGEGMEALVDFTGLVGAFEETDGGRLVFIGNALPEQTRSYNKPDLLIAEGPWPCRSPRVLTAGYDGDIGSQLAADQHPPRGGGRTPLAVAPDGKSAITVATRHGAAMLARVSLADGAVTELTPATMDVVWGAASGDGRLWALCLGSPERPGDIHLFDGREKSLRKLWGPNDAMLEGMTLGSVEEIWYPSFDGRKIQAWVMKPPGFDPAKRYPLVVQIHGGPHAAYGYGFFHEFHVLAAAGYVVLYTNPRGSTSYGQEFANVIQYRYPGDDAKDILAGVDALIARGYVDEKRLGITGGSGGGLLTNWIIAQTDRFAAAITQRCVSDWASMVYSCDFTMFTPVWFRKQPFEDPEEYRALSPISLAAKITTPLMIIHSEEDWRTPIAQGEAMFRALKQQRKAAVMVRFPGENHELSRSGAPSRRVQNQRHIRGWFDRWLMGVAKPEYEE